MGYRVGTCDAVGSPTPMIWCEMFTPSVLKRTLMISKCIIADL